ncbi:MAG: TonB-dependent receptor [Acidobacteriaceae bacterium]|nr:TonB-dependent receptor [Acidobacteriaceae bacterium]
MHAALLSRFSILRILAPLALLICGTESILGQLSSASVNGAVRDSTGAAVVRAKIVLRNLGTAVSHDTVSNGSGNYLFSDIPPGSYSLEVSAPGFQSAKIPEVTLAVNQTSSLDFQLKVGEIQQSVTVEAQGTQVESSTAELGTVIAQRQVVDLPLNGRNFTQLLTLTPGATPISVGQNSSGSNTAATAGSAFSFPSVNGQPNRSNYFLVDGLNDQNAWYNTYAVAPIIDAIQEFKVNSHNDAQFGQVTGGVINVVTKSGTNDLHGSAWEYLRNDFFDARSTFLTTVTPYRQNQFGGTLGGPVLVPKLYNGRNKTFFFVGAEGFRYSKPSNNFYIVPTPAELSGNLSAVKTPLYDPFSTRPDPSKPGQYLRTPYPNNQIPASEIDPHAVAFASAVLPTPIQIPGVSAYNAVITAPMVQTQENYTGRIDHTIGTKDFLWFRYSGQELDTTQPGAIASLQATSLLPSQQYGASWVHVFNPTTSMQVQYARTHVEYDTATAFTVPNVLGTYGVSQSLGGNYINGISLMPNLTVTGYWSGGEVSSPADNLSNIHQYKATGSKTIGKHELQFGGEWNEINYSEILRQTTVTFLAQQTGNPENSAQPGDALASFLLDVPSSANKRNVNITERPGGIMGFFLTDSWKATSRLTLNIGLRYDRTFIPGYGTQATVGQQGSIETGDMNFNNGTFILQQVPPTCAQRGHAPCIPGDGTLPAHVVVSPNGKILHDTKTNFGPRFGLAYRVNNSTAIRGGFGIFYDNWAAAIQLPQNYQGSWPDIGQQETQNLNQPGAVYTPAQNPFGNAAATLPSASPFTVVNYYVDPYIKNPYSEQWNLGVEHQFGQDMMLSVNYVGSESHRLDIGGYYNTALTPGPGPITLRQPYPYIVPTRYDRSWGNGSYNALQVSFQKRYSSGLSYQAAYTWGKAIDEGQSGWFGVEGNNLQNPYDLRGSRSVAAYDITHLATLNLTYELPVGNGKRFSTGNRILDYVVGNWQTNVIFMARSGQPYTITATGDIANTGNTGYERANLVGNPTLPNPMTAEWFNTAAFAIPATYTYGNLGRNTLRSQAYWNTDFSVFRQFPIRERMRFELRGEAFNVFNTVVYGIPGHDITTPSTFGKVSTLANNPRTLQLAAKFSF